MAAYSNLQDHLLSSEDSLWDLGSTTNMPLPVADEDDEAQCRTMFSAVIL